MSTVLEISLASTHSRDPSPSDDSTRHREFVALPAGRRLPVPRAQPLLGTEQPEAVHTGGERRGDRRRPECTRGELPSGHRRCVPDKWRHQIPGGKRPLIHSRRSLQQHSVCKKWQLRESVGLPVRGCLFIGYAMDGSGAYHIQSRAPIRLAETAPTPRSVTWICTVRV